MTRCSFTSKALALIACLWLSLPAAQAALPAKVQIDLLTTRLAQQIEKEDFNGATTTLSELRKLGAKLPVDYLFIEALTLSRSGQATKAKALLEQYLAQAGDKGRYYTKALELYASVDEQARGEAMERWGQLLDQHAVTLGGGENWIIYRPVQVPNGDVWWALGSINSGGTYLPDERYFNASTGMISKVNLYERDRSLLHPGKDAIWQFGLSLRKTGEQGGITTWGKVPSMRKYLGRGTEERWSDFIYGDPTDLVYAYGTTRDGGIYLVSGKGASETKELVLLDNNGKERRRTSIQDHIDKSMTIQAVVALPKGLVAILASNMGYKTEFKDGKNVRTAHGQRGTALVLFDANGRVLKSAYQAGRDFVIGKSYTPFGNGVLVYTEGYDLAKDARINGAAFWFSAEGLTPVSSGRWASALNKFHWSASDDNATTYFGGGAIIRFKSLEQIREWMDSGKDPEDSLRFQDYEDWFNRTQKAVAAGFFANVDGTYTLAGWRPSDASKRSLFQQGTRFIVRLDKHFMPVPVTPLPYD